MVPHFHYILPARKLTPLPLVYLGLFCSLPQYIPYYYIYELLDSETKVPRFDSMFFLYCTTSLFLSTLPSAYLWKYAYYTTALAAVVFTLTRRYNAVRGLTGQAPISLERKITSGLHRGECKYIAVHGFGCWSVGLKAALTSSEAAGTAIQCSKRPSAARMTVTAKASG